MSRDAARSLIGTVLRRLGLAGVIVLVFSLPALWLAWEATEAHAQAALLAEAGSTSIQGALLDMFSRFERATASLRAQDLQGDTVSLTGRLLRVEPLVAPATGLSVVNNRGLQVASSSVGTTANNVPVWWFRTGAPPPARQAVVTGCGITDPEVSGWMLTRGIDAVPDGSAGQVASDLSAAALRTLVAPASTALDYRLRDPDGCELLQVTGKTTAAITNEPLVRLYYALLPTRWLMPAPAVSTAQAGNLTWTGTVSPETELALRAGEIEQHARIVLALLITFGGLTSLLIVSEAVEPRWPGIFVAAPVSAPLLPGEVATQEMVELRGKLSAMAGERDRVLAAIGHDVRTPMNAILGICALLLDGDLDETQRKWLRRIRASCEALLAMLNGMLEIAAARVDGAEIHREAIDVASLVEEVGDVLRPQAEDKGLDLLIAVEESVLGCWNTDSTRLRQVLFNLCGNAIKYTVAGSVEIRALTERDKAGHQMLRLRVSDTGLGIAEDEREVIFEQFRRGRDEVSRGQEGLGLGLALCREIAALLGGRLTLDSMEGVGSVFTFEIPIEPAQTQGALGGPLAGRTAVVVGLSEGVRRRVASHLENIGFDVETAGDGFMAIGLAERMAYQHGTLDLMVLDAALVGLSADALLARLKASRPLEHLRTVLVANGAVATLMEGRADATVPHPVEARDLDHVVADFFGARSPLQEINPRAPAAPKARVLVVEDNRINQALLVDQLNRTGFSTFAASDGKEAVEAVRRGGFDAILMDVQMPEIDGIEATRRIRTSERRYRIPIIGLTAHTGSVVRKRCLDAGMDLVLHKPVDFSCLPLRLREVIAAAHVATVGEADGDMGRKIEGGLEIDDEYLEILLAEVGVKRARICVTAFLADTTVHLSAMARLMNGNEWDELGRLAHSLSGIAGTLGAINLADGLLMLEDAARLEGQVHVDTALNDVRSTWERTRIMISPRFEALAAARSRAASNRAA
ncbi:MAG: response regulator [Acetobacteraceae bacterium]|jgi:signal transduction histidine kinase/CheY-like chemotaxis protein